MLSLFISIPLVAAPAPSDALVVGYDGSYATIQAAVDAAQDGDLVLVRIGTYAGFVIDGKSLVVQADGPVSVEPGVLKSCIQVQNVPAGSRVVIRGFFAQMPTS